MNSKQLVKLLALVLVVGGIGLFFYNRNKTSWQSSTVADNKLFSNLPVNEITHVALKKNADEVNLEKKNDIWTVHERKNYPANFDTIRDLIQKVSSAKVVQSEAIGA